jgi:hypothetical protein
MLRQKDPQKEFLHDREHALVGLEKNDLGRHASDEHHPGASDPVPVSCGGVSCTLPLVQSAARICFRTNLVYFLLVAFFPANLVSFFLLFQFILLIANMDVPRYILVLDISILVTSNMGQRQ